MEAGLSKESAQEEFDRLHPQAGLIGQKRLYRFQGLPPAPSDNPAIQAQRSVILSRLRELLVGQWLFHAPPSKMNDPFEGKPHYQPSKTAKDASGMRQHLKDISKERGIPWKARREFVGKFMARPDKDEAIAQTMLDTYELNRLCSFTTRPDAILFWSYYGDSHYGVCFEFKTSGTPLAHAFKVNYSESYPTVSFPVNHHLDALKPILTKSCEWHHENEYRSLIQPRDTPNDWQTLNDAKTHLLIPDDCLTGVYFGTQATDAAKSDVLRLIEEGPFSPEIHHGSLSKTNYKLVF